jgi:hypothetical protein
MKVGQFALLSEERQALLYRLVESPNEAVKHCGYGYDVLRKAALGGPLYDWVAEAILAGLKKWKDEKHV